MTSKSKAKGSYHENWFKKLFESWGLKVRKQPLSGALGGEYSGDLVVTLNDVEYVTEVKYRKEKGFPSPFTVLKNRDVAVFKLGTAEPDAPKWVLIIPDHIAEKLIKGESNE
jgi:hypothetical protein